MTKRMCLILLTMILLTVPGLAWAADSPTASLPNKDAIIAAANLIEQEPFSQLGDTARGVIEDFAVKSDDVTVILAPSLLPWYGKSQWDKMLVGSYFAGNVRAQLQQHKKQNDSYAGTLMVLHTYSEIQKNDKSFQLPELEKFKTLEQNHKLQQYLVDLEAKVTDKIKVAPSGK